MLGRICTGLFLLQNYGRVEEKPKREGVREVYKGEMR
jgi:hypothetical protein